MLGGSLRVDSRPGSGRKVESDVGLGLAVNECRSEEPHLDILEQTDDLVSGNPLADAPADLGRLLFCLAEIIHSYNHEDGPDVRALVFPKAVL
jgi:hypothetical protein